MQRSPTCVRTDVNEIVSQLVIFLKFDKAVPPGICGVYNLAYLSEVLVGL